MADGFLRRRLTNNPDLYPRIVSAVVIVAVSFVPLLVGGWLLSLLVAAATGTMAWEFRRITQPGIGARAAGLFALPAAAAALLAASVPLGPLAAGLALVAVAFAASDRLSGRDWRWGSGGLLVLGAAGMAFVALRARDADGLVVVLWIAASVVATDIGAYAAGRRFGGPKLWPRVSPKKTWSGLAGGVLAAMASGGSVAVIWGGAGVLMGCGASGLLAVIAQGGDLAESAVKRRFGVKDASALIPGHGGALDRLDGFLSATLAVALTTWVHGKPVFLT